MGYHRSSKGCLRHVADYIACIDPELQHDPGILRDMVSALNDGAKLAVGVLSIKGRNSGGNDLVRRFRSWIATKMAQLFLGVTLQVLSPGISCCGAMICAKSALT